MKYLVHWKSFTVEHNTWKKETDSENVVKTVTEFEKILSAEIGR